MDSRSLLPRSLAAVLFAVIAGTLGAGALMAGPAQAVGAVTPPPCGNDLGQKLCGPTATVSPATVATTGGDEQITVTWAPAPGLSMDPAPASTGLTMQWAPPTNVPPGAAQPISGPVTATGTCSTSGANLVCAYDWPSNLAVSGYILNGTYSLSASSDDCRIAVIGVCSAKTTTTGTATVVNPPLAPSKVTAALVPGGTGVTIEWAPNPEPDVVGYEVLRSNGGVVCMVRTYPPQTDVCTDSDSGGGSFSYKVIAYRYGASYDAAAEVSTASTATTAVTVAGPPAPSSTVPPGGGTAPITQPGFTATPSPSKVKTSGGTGGGTFAATPSAAPAAVTTTTSGGSFSPVLPYGAQPQSPPPSADPQALGVPRPASKGSTPIGTIAAIGAGLLVAVIALHGLWLRAEVRRVDTLEPLDPEG